MAMNAEMLLRNKGIIKERTDKKETTLKLKSLEGKIDDATIRIKSLSFDEINKIQEDAGTDKMKMDILTCYKAVIEPDLKDKKLQEGFGCKGNPYGIVEEIFEKQEVMFISSKIAELSGLGKIKAEDVIEEIKNV